MTKQYITNTHRSQCAQKSKLFISFIHALIEVGVGGGATLPWPWQLGIPGKVWYNELSILIFIIYLRKYKDHNQEV